jgi:hypothetical protein
LDAKSKDKILTEYKEVARDIAFSNLKKIARGKDGFAR